MSRWVPITMSVLPAFRSSAPPPAPRRLEAAQYVDLNRKIGQPPAKGARVLVGENRVGTSTTTWRSTERL
jgi:hypothetical protein